MGCGVNLIALICALFIVLSRQYDNVTEIWACGVSARIITWWLKPETRRRRYLPTRIKDRY